MVSEMQQRLYTTDVENDDENKSHHESYSRPPSSCSMSNNSVSLEDIEALMASSHASLASPKDSECEYPSQHWKELNKPR